MPPTVYLSAAILFAILSDDGVVSSEKAAARELDLPGAIASLRRGTEPQEFLKACELQGISFICDREALTALRQAGANSWLLNRISRYCTPIAGECTRAAAAFSAGNYTDTTAIATKVLDKCPRFLEMLWIRARARFELSQLKECRKDFELIREYDPNYVFSWTPHSLENGQRIDTARHNETVSHLILETRLSAGEFAEVIYESGIEIESGKHVSPLLFELRAMAHQQLGQHEQALMDYTLSILQGPFDTGAWSSMSLLLSTTSSDRLRDPEAAQELAYAALVLARSRAEQASALNALAASLAADNQFSEAERQQSRAVHLAAGSVHAVYRQRLTDYRAKRKSVLEFKGHAPDSPDVVVRILSRMKRIEGGSLPPESRIPRSDSNPIRVKPFYLSALELTRRDWSEAYRRPIESHHQHPIDRVSWTDCQKMIRTLNRRIPGEAAALRLPTEAEWEFAARGVPDGSVKGNVKLDPEKEEKDLTEFAWYQENSGQRLHDCGQLKPNAFGLYDMLGNAAEWCSDHVAAGKKETFRIHRGGSFASSDAFANWTVRGFYPAGDRRIGLGVRLAVDGDIDIRSLIRRVDVQPAQGFEMLLSEASTSQADSALDDSAKLIADLRLTQAHAMILAARNDSAIQILEDFVNSAPRSSKHSQVAQAALAWIFATSGSPDQRMSKRAETLANELNSPGNDQFWPASIALAAVAANRGDYGQAIMLIDGAISQARARSPAYLDLMQLKRGMKKRAQLPTDQMPSFISAMITR